jgi:hypothetical protein
MIQVEKSADKYLLRDDGIELVFCFAGDRWQHSVGLRREDDWHAVLISVEGRPADAALPSPAFQDLRFEQPAEGVYEFQLMGQSGKGIYSAAVRYDALARMLDFDLCARGPAANFSLCTVSTYRLAGLDQLPIVNCEPGAAMLTATGCGRIRITPVPIAGSPHSECRLNGEPGQRRLTIGCFGVAGSLSAGKTGSIRWRQQFAFAGRP